jgi:hypothetical protein
MKPAKILAVFDVFGCVILASSLLLLHVVFASASEMKMGTPGGSETSWRETPPIRVTMRSTADWARIMFDDEIGNNTNGIRFKRILSFGWLKGNDSDDEISIGKGTWYDVLYNVTVRKTGDIVAFNKQRNDFDYAEMYADVVFETDAGMISGYIWLMLAGQGITTFQLSNLEHQYVLWQETLSGTGHTRHLRRYVMLDSFYRRWEVSPTSIAVLTLVALLVMVLLSPIIPSRKKRQVGRTHLTNRTSSTRHPVALERSL